ncbi:hypothetical protein KGQ19_32335 [Catenulispora sp. NL8]|uniref:Solute-binding protein family 5 domain-containing protein n=1 Tax=Catenulispora pinistramenti TaxID=2705254 RepID=A0ABS5L004_9ACTN|nr:ABC transporter substrate-binding protein [Catenulispora pinistramenti]MBS2551567.1 hypothetical protein [Catenulispora pinistramenti]
MTHSRRTAWAVAACTAGVFLAASACTTSDNAVSGSAGSAGSAGRTSTAAAQPVDGGTLRIGLDRPFAKIDPTDGSLMSQPLLILADAVFDPLMVNDAKGGVTPYLAKSFTPSGDAKTWTLQLRDGVKFSDGSALDAQAVIDHIHRLSDPAAKCSCAVDAAAIGAMTATGPTEVTFTLKTPDAAFPNMFTRALGYIAKVPAGSTTAIGSGPYTVSEVQAGVSATVVRNPDYWGTKGHADKIVYKVLTDADSRAASVRSGDEDLVWNETPALLKQARADGLQVDTGLGGTSTILINTKQAPFDDPRVRQALQAAIDRSALEKVVDLGQGRVSDGPIGATSPYHSAAASYPAFDTAKAKQLLGGKKVSFQYIVTNDPQSQQRATLLQQMLGDAGIAMTIKPVDQATWGTLLYQHQFQVMDFVTSLYGDADTAIAEMFGSKSPMNFVGYSNPEVDQSIATGRAALDPAVRGAAYNKAAAQIVADAPTLFLTQTATGFIASAKVGGLPDLSHMTTINVSPTQLWVGK